MNHDEFEHGEGGYTNHKCRCEVCREGQRIAVTRRRQQRYAQRVLVNGQLVSLVGEHGKVPTYTNYGCRCTPCRGAMSEHHQRWIASKKAAS